MERASLSSGERLSATSSTEVAAEATARALAGSGTGEAVKRGDAAEKPRKRTERGRQPETAKGAGKAGPPRQTPQGRPGRAEHVPPRLSLRCAGPESTGSETTGPGGDGPPPGSPSRAKPPCGRSPAVPRSRPPAPATPPQATKETN